MKKILILLLIPFYMYSVTISINSAKENGRVYKILHVKNKKPIYCETKVKAYDKKLYLCMFDGNLKNQIKDKKTPFVDMDFISKQDKFYVYIKPKFKSIMINNDAKLYEDKTIPILKGESSKHWVIYLYQEDELFKQNGEGINFPITYSFLQYPYIGTLDLNGKPMDYAQSDDINLYLKLKKTYKKGNFKEAFYISKNIIKKYPNSIFISDILLLKLKSMDKILEDQNLKEKFDRNDLVTQTKAWLKTFTTDKSRPEALMLLVKQYIHLRSKSNLNYFLDMLLTEYPKDISTQKAIILYANYLYTSKHKKNEAIRLYEDVLYSSKDLDVASLAAIKLAQTSLEKGKKQKAKEYLQKVLNANENFIHKNRTESYQLAQKFAKNDLSSLAAKVAKILFENSKRFDESYEVLLKDTGIWFEKASNTDQAYKYLKLYQKKFPYGDYRVLVQQALDRLFFKLDETNETKLIAHYDKLIDKYDNNIQQKALQAKANLLLKQKKYNKVLNMQDILLKNNNDTISNNIIKKAAQLYMQENLNKDMCQNVVQTALKHPDAVEAVNNDEGFYRCYLRLLRYNKAKLVAQKHINEEKIPVRLEWMLKFQHALYKNGEFKTSIQVAKDIENLGNILQSSLANIALYDRYFALIKLKKYEDALNIAKKIEEKFPDNFKNVEVYAGVMKIAKNESNDLVVVSYAKKALKLEKKHKNFLLSPKLEYDLIQALQNLNRLDEANKIALKLLQRELKNTKKTRAFYTIAESFIKIGDEQNASRYFQKCVSQEANSSWNSICKENLKLLDINKTKKP